MSTPIYVNNSDPTGPTLETERLPVVGASRRRREGRMVFLRRYAIVLTGFFVVRIVLDLASLGG